MYAEKKCTPENSNHQSIANEIANSISGFEPSQQNEMLRTIKQIIAERRQLEVERMEKQLAYLIDTLQNL